MRYNHGPNEHGKDIIYSEENKFGTTSYYAVQAKAGDVGSSRFMELADEVEQAFSNPFKHPITFDPCYIDTLIVATSGKFTANIIDRIQNSAAIKYWRGSIMFLDGQSVRDLVEKYWVPVSVVSEQACFEKTSCSHTDFLISYITRATIMALD